MKQELALRAALGSHWTKSNKSMLLLSRVRDAGTVVVVVVVVVGRDG